MADFRGARVNSGQASADDPDLRDRLYELLEHDHLPNSVGSRFVRLIIAIIVLDVLAMILASVPEIDAQFGALFTAIEIGAVIAFALEYVARLWTIAGHSMQKLSPARARLGYIFSSLGIIDLLSFLPSGIALVMGDRITLVLTGMLPFLKLVRYSPALRSLLSAIHAERRALFGCVVILTGAVLLFACLLYATEHKVQPEKFGNIPQAMWWAIVTLGTVGYGDAVPVTVLGKMVSTVAIVDRLCHDRAAGRHHLDRFCRGSAAARFRRHLGHARPRAAVLASGRRRNCRHHAAVARADDRGRRGAGAPRRPCLLDVFHHHRRGRDRPAEPAGPARPTAPSSARSRCCAAPTAAAR